MKKLKAVVLIAVLCGLSGCATTNRDPLEGINRGIYKFNDVADKYAMKPVAKAYKAVAPEPVRTGISNFFSNLGTLTTIVNDLLQLKFAQAFTDAGRFVINSTFGIAGFIDVAGKDNIAKHNEDFGQTLGYWGVGSGAYLVLPILGPSTVRDVTGLAFDTVTSDPVTYLHNTGQIRAHNQVRLVQLLDRRTQLLDAKDLVDDASIDPYAFMRDAYLQRRASLIQDGLVPAELLQDDFEPEDEEPATDSMSPEPASSAIEATTLQSAALIEEPAEAIVAEEIQQPVAEDVSATTIEQQAAPELTADVTENTTLAPQEELPPLLEQSLEQSQVEQQPAEMPVVLESDAVPADVVAGVDDRLLTQELPAIPQ
ncbi:phospholipid-binding lipoprotein MlaA [Methylophilus rhizosphaerae]|uniref:Phospholipid-binding lipoprotein MlaA n=1 Tax=Methylophilus rhizosphaerae TaxID=492660 RepID=A0A1G8ZX24_9PROT|nr:VacJ family lipoprotein [Methylophilus rhizosphaerae]SDK19613.1 phospholipid-binding lipoprotein MlaA [Methylophilus rhizosphaerae]